MIMPILISLLTGMLVAQQFKVLILLPIMLLSAVFTIGVGFARAERPWVIPTAAVLAIVSVQIGYLLGLAAHHLMVLARANRIHSGSPPNAVRRRTAH